MLQRLLARARSHRRLSNNRKSNDVAGRSVLPEPLERRVLMAASLAVGSPGGKFEGDTGSFAFTIHATGDPGTYNYTYATGGTASAGTEYTAVTGSSSVTIAPGMSVGFGATVNVPLLGNDEHPDDGETVTLTFASNDAALGTPTGSATITDVNDMPYVLGGGTTGPATPPAAGGRGFNAAGLRSFDGTPVVEAHEDLGASGFGAAWDVRRSFNAPLAGRPAAATGVHGKGWVAAERPHLVQSGSIVVAVDSGTGQRWFDLSGGTYTARFFVQDKLTTSTGEFVLTDAAGNVTRYYDFGGGIPALQRGTFKSLTDAAGNVTSVHSSDGSGRATEVRRSGGGVTESLLYAHVAAGANAGLVETVTLRRSTDGGSTWGTVRTAEYTYFDGTLTGAHAFGHANYLRTAIVKDAAGATLKTEYYRYHLDDSATGQRGAIRLVLKGDSYERPAADGAVADPLTASDAKAEEYADNRFSYDSRGRVAESVVRGEGVGTQTRRLEYVANPATTGGIGYDEWNAWEYRTTETLPDGNQHIALRQQARRGDARHHPGTGRRADADRHHPQRHDRHGHPDRSRLRQRRPGVRRRCGARRRTTARS